MTKIMKNRKPLKLIHLTSKEMKIKSNIYFKCVDDSIHLCLYSPLSAHFEYPLKVVTDLFLLCVSFAMIVCILCFYSLLLSYLWCIVFNFPNYYLQLLWRKSDERWFICSLKKYSGDLDDLHCIIYWRMNEEGEWRSAVQVCQSVDINPILKVSSWQGIFSLTRLMSVTCGLP